MRIPVNMKMLARNTCLILFLLASVGGKTWAQSTDVAWPSPIRTSEVTATIGARDVGDPRVTDHFYAFTATPGDLTVKVESRNLNGDIDVFTVSGLRPLLKFTIYAGNSSPITKSIYLRKQEDLILRVEGRTPNDDDATYRIEFSGAFSPITSGPLAEHEDALQAATPAAAPEKAGKRVSSVGARIDEPRSEVAETPAPAPTPVETPEPKAVATKPARNSRTRRPTTRRVRPAPTVKAEETEAKREAEGEAPTASSETETKTTAKSPRPNRRSTGPRRAAKPAEPQEPEATGPRLIIETSDGTLVDRYMNTVRRVTVEKGQVVVLGNDGVVQRIPLANVVRMTISP